MYHPPPPTGTKSVRGLILRDTVDADVETFTIPYGRVEMADYSNEWLNESAIGALNRGGIKPQIGAAACSMQDRPNRPIPFYERALYRRHTTVDIKRDCEERETPLYKQDVGDLYAQLTKKMASKCKSTNR